MADGHKLTLYGVHLKSNRGGADSSRLRRERAVDYLFWDWKRRGLDPSVEYILIMGDFNTSVLNPVFEKEQTLRRLMKAGFKDAAEGLPVSACFTVPTRPGGRFPPVDFDHILVSSPLAHALRDKPPWIKILPTSSAISDHYPLFITIDTRSGSK